MEDTNNRQIPLFKFQSFGTVAKLNWQPTCRYHIACSTPTVDPRIHVWDIRRTYLPQASFCHYQRKTSLNMSSDCFWQRDMTKEETHANYFCLQTVLVIFFGGRTRTIWSQSVGMKISFMLHCPVPLKLTNSSPYSLWMSLPKVMYTRRCPISMIPMFAPCMLNDIFPVMWPVWKSSIRKRWCRHSWNGITPSRRNPSLVFFRTRLRITLSSSSIDSLDIGSLAPVMQRRPR